jgi:hypothetical protein
MKNWQDGAVSDWIEELADVPRSGEWARFGLSVADHCGDYQIRIIEGGATGMGQDVAQFPSFMD